MYTFGFIQIGLILLCTITISSLTCNHLPLQQRRVIESSLQLLDKMGRRFPQQCLREKMSFRFPEQVLKPRQKETVKVAIEEILQHIVYIFSKNLTLAAWDGAALEQFQNGLYQQIEQLEACIIKKQTQYFWSKEVNRLKLKKYFQKIDSFLKEKQHNLCSWEISRAEMRRCLQLIDKVIRKLYKVDVLSSASYGCKLKEMMTAIGIRSEAEIPQRKPANNATMIQHNQKDKRVRSHQKNYS